MGPSDMNTYPCYGYDEASLKKWFRLSVNTTYIIYGKTSTKIQINCRFIRFLIFHVICDFILYYYLLVVHIFMEKRTCTCIDSDNFGVVSKHVSIFSVGLLKSEKQIILKATINILYNLNFTTFNVFKIIQKFLYY